jgi:hypothetical protein
MTRRDAVRLRDAMPELPVPVTGPAADGDALSPETMEALIVGGDLGKLTATQRVEVYIARCKAAGLDPRTSPLAYLNLQGKLTLYATKAATDQLSANRRLSVQIVDRRHISDLGLYEVVCRVTHPDGRISEDVGVVPMGQARGDAAGNLIMKAITKAKRRAILSACGLGMLDETETETIPGAVTVPLAAVHAAEPVKALDVQAEPEQLTPKAEQSTKEQVTKEQREEIRHMWQLLGWGPKACRDHVEGWLTNALGHAPGRGAADMTKDEANQYMAVLVSAYDPSPAEIDMETF